MLSIGLSQDRSAPRRQNTVMVFAEIVDDVLLNVAESLFALAVKKLTDGTTQALLNDAVGIQKRQAESTPHLSADGRFARSREANKNNEQKKKFKVEMSP
jgi:hypothetical protein